VTPSSVPTTDPAPAGTYGPYRTTETLVPGAQDAVYLAERVDTGARVALRVYAEDAARDEDLVRALRDHAGRLTALCARSSAIAAVYECGVTPEGALYIALEPPEGETLAEALRRDGPFAPERAVRLAIGLAEPLEVAHMMGVVHGCLSPQNISLVGGDETVKLTQFGFDWVRTTRWLSRRGARAVGAAITPYQAPEQGLTGEATNQSDVYAVGALLYEMLTGRPPGTRLVMRRGGGTMPLRKLRPDASRTLDKIVMRALSPAPARRHRDMTDLFNDLWSEISPFSGGEPRGARRGLVGSGRRVALAAAVLVVAAGAAVVLATGWLGERNADTLLSPRARVPAEAPLSPAPSPPSTAAPVAPAPEPVTVAPAPATAAPVAAAPEPVTPAPKPVRPAPTLPPRPASPPVPREIAPSRAPSTARAAAPRPATERAPSPAATRVLTQPAAPAPAPAARETDDGGGAIIDWLLKEGSPARR
jgi:eukaryotic-like serine/threonine-protein kinase